MTLNGVMAVTLRYFTEFGKHTFQHITAASICGAMPESIVFCSTCTMSSYRKFTFAISSPDEFLVNSRVAYLAKNHYENYSTQMVPTNPTAPWPISVVCITFCYVPINKTVHVLASFLPKV